MKPDIKDLSPIPDLKQATEQLRFFYLVPQQGGFANDGNIFKAAIRFSDKNDLLDKMDKLGVDIRKNKSMSREEYNNRKLKDFTDLVDPGQAIIDEVKCIISIHKGSIEFLICGTGTDNPYSFTMADFNASLRLEKIFEACRFDQSMEI